MLRPLLLHLSHAAWARKSLVTFPLARSAARRFVAGESVDDAMRSIRTLNTAGIQATVDHLGENVTTEAEARLATGAYLEALDRIEATGVQSNVSLKLTQFGLDISEGLCTDNLRRVLHRAHETHNFVRVDMESTQYTERTIRVVRRARHELGCENVGAVIQAYLYRSEADLCALATEGVPIRLCKGAYDEPPELAFPRKQDVDANFLKLAGLLLDQSAASTPSHDHNGKHPPLAAIATHDEKMIDGVKEYAARRGIPPDRYEFQMLHGIRRELQLRLAADGYRMRVYVPYGTEWYPYFMRRLAERPANLWFFATSFFRK